VTSSVTAIQALLLETLSEL